LILNGQIGQRGLGKHGIAKLRRGGIFVETTTEQSQAPSGAAYSDEILPAFDGKHDMDVNLGIGVGHARKMPLLTEPGNLFRCGCYKYVVPMALCLG